MEWKNTIVISILLIIVMGMAGCTGSPQTPVAIPAPVSVAATVPQTPAPVQTTAPVTTKAAWTTETPATGHPYSKTYSFEGTGDYLQEFTTTSDGTWVYRMHYPGEEIFIVTIKDNRGDDIEVLAHEGGSFTGTKSVWLKAGSYYLDVAANAPWTITMSTA